MAAIRHIRGIRSFLPGSPTPDNGRCWPFRPQPSSEGCNAQYCTWFHATVEVLTISRRFDKNLTLTPAEKAARLP
jgi:hypothetical protein